MQKTQQKSLLLASLSGYFAKNPSNRAVLREIISGESKVSLRVIDWFVTHYANVKDVAYWLDDKGRLIETPRGQTDLSRFNLYLEYRTQLKSYTKLHFDPFRRHERITFIVETQPEIMAIETTVGQLNFFRWAIQNRVVQFIMNHLSEIETAMQSSEFVMKPKAKADAASITTRCNISKGNKTKTLTSAGGGAAAAQQSQPTVQYAQCRLRFD